MTLLLVALSMGCGLGPSDALRAAPPDPEPDLLFRDFLDGKMDGAGHPIGATVFEAESDCDAETGWPTADALDFDPRYDGPGSVCTQQTPELGKGPYVVNVRAALREACADAECEAPLSVTVRDDTDAILAEATIESADFTGEGAYENRSLTFRLNRPTRVRVSIDYSGFGAVTLDYVEVFRQGRQLVLSPPSGVLSPDDDLRIEVVDPPDEHVLRVRCDDVDLDDRFQTMLADGVAREELTDFRRIVTVPAAALLEGCRESTQVVVRLSRTTWDQETSEVRYTPEAAPCAFEGEGDTRVLLTGFVPFPAGADQDNSSMQAVLGFEPSVVPDARVMKMILPVEFDGSAALVMDAVDRCQPDVVVGFGQGRDRVDLEGTAYNRRDTSDVLGGIPDNRGLVVEPSAIDQGGPDTLATELPVDAIEADLVQAGIAVSHSDDPGRYICNDLFYSITGQGGSEARTTGFVHMPYVRHVTDEKREELASVVASVVRRTLEARAEPDD